jgi:hypothetical protein
MVTLRSKTLQGLVLASAGYLVRASLGAALAIATDLPARFGGLLTGTDVAHDFLLGGTALSPDLPLLLGQLVLTGCALRGGRTGMVGVIGLTVLGAVYALGQLGEPIALRALSPATFNAAQATLVAANIVFPTLMAVFGALEWRNRRRVGRMLAT